MTDERQRVSPWVPMTDPIDIKHLGKLIEELNELGSAASRCLIQGIDECEPDTGKVNRLWLEEEIADALANIELVMWHFDLNGLLIHGRRIAKQERLRIWHAMEDGPASAAYERAYAKPMAEKAT